MMSTYVASEFRSYILKHCPDREHTVFNKSIIRVSTHTFKLLISILSLLIGMFC